MTGESTTEATGAQDLDSVLSDYESKTTPQTQPQTSPDIAAKVDKIYDAFQAQEQAQEKADIQNVVSAVKGEADIDEGFVEAWVGFQAKTDPSIEEAFINRKANPSAWQEAQMKLQTTFNEKFQQIDRKATDDTQEMVAAVTGSKQTNQQPDQAPDYMKMSTEDFNKELEKLGIR